MWKRIFLQVIGDTNRSDGLGELSTELYRKARACIRSTGSTCVVRKARRKTRRLLRHGSGGKSV